VGSGSSAGDAYEFETIVFGTFSFSVAADSAISGVVSVNLPSAPQNVPLVSGTYTQSSSGKVFSVVGVVSGSTLSFGVSKVGGFTYDGLEDGDFSTFDAIDASTPVAPASGDVLAISFMYEQSV
jgi:hypothetical protein